MDQGAARDGGGGVNSAFAWLFDPEHWSGPAGFPARILEHLGYTALTVLIAAVIAVPLGAVVGHTGRGDVPGRRAVQLAARAARRSAC